MKKPCAYACLALATGAGLGAIGAAAQTADERDPLAWFSELMPVVTHARCMGCHGAVNPFEGTTHGGGEIDVDFDWRHGDMNETSQNRTCLECHTAGVTEQVVVPGPNGFSIKSGKWRLAPKHLAFVNKSTKEICRQFVRFARLQSHLELDELIGFAFIGKRGDATLSADPPPMNRREFLDAMHEWFDKGYGVCGTWEGSITQTEEFGSNYGYDMPTADGLMHVAVSESAKRDIHVQRRDGLTFGTFTMSGHQTMVQTMRMTGPNGPCTAVITSNTDWRSTTPASVQASIRMQIRNDGSYTIYFAGPEETTVTDANSHSTNDCGIALPPSTTDPPIDLTWPKWIYTIRCPSSAGICRQFDRAQAEFSGRTLIHGLTEETVLGASDAAERKSWLNVSPVGTSRSDDGAPMPVKVKTTWNLTLAP